MRYSIEPRNRKYIDGYEFLSFSKTASKVVQKTTKTVNNIVKTAVVAINNQTNPTFNVTDKIICKSCQSFNSR